MLTKIGTHFDEDFLSNSLDFLTLLDFHNPICIKKSPGIEVWKARKFDANYFIKIINKYGPYAENISLETTIHRKFNPGIYFETYDHQNLSCLAIIELEKFRPESIQELRIVLNKYRSQPSEEYFFLPANRNLERLLTYAEKAVNNFTERRLIDSRIASNLKDSIQSISLFSQSQATVLCHGDVGDANFYQRNEGPVLLDWEDCFWGFAGFDEIYYLTFLSNRFMISESTFKETGLDIEIAKATFALIVTLKEFIHSKSNLESRKYSLIERLNFVNF